MGLRQERTAVAAATAAANEEPPPDGKGTKEPDLKKNGEQELTRPAVADAISSVVAADEHDVADQPQPQPVLSEPAATAGDQAEAACTLRKHVADASSSDKDVSKKRDADHLTANGEEAHLFLVDAATASCTTADSKNHGGSIDKKYADQIQVHEDNGCPLRMPPMKTKKKLLILDLNGLLADINQDKHNAHLSHGKFRGKLVFKRPYCDDFLRFCIQHFELGIWSSRLRANVDAVVDILMKDLKHHLLFCWDLSKCTSTGFNTLENKNKPLVLKELKKLWDKEVHDDFPCWQWGEFSPSNTLLVDDSPYKALHNPPHTAIFPCPYSYKNDKDDALGPGGDLHLYLESLAIADDVQGYVREHPFGQPPISETDPDWDFYKQILLLE